MNRLTQVTIKIPLITAKITLIGAIENVVRYVDKYKAATEYKAGIERGAIENQHRLQGTSYALSCVFGKDVDDRIFTATNNCIEDIDVAALRTILEEIEEKYSDEKCFK